MANRISTLISAFGVLAGTMLLLLGVREYRAGASILWVGWGVLIFASAVVALVRDVRRSRENASAEA
ncbi:hypothetical protein [Streptomyces sp. 2A115]|uniref:hypothetical protein n=1 Tax=Streptomyces sp. 2A115 TaxID=3457439 RepID=UPI003FD18103